MTPLITAAALFDPLSAAIVVGGTLLVVLLRSPWSELRGDLHTLVARKHLHQAVASVARLEQAISRVGPFAVDPAVPEDADLDMAARLLCHAPRPAELETLFAEQRVHRTNAVEQACALVTSAAETAPTLGLIGTVLGLMSLFSTGGTAALSGGGLSTALVTTLYGAVLGTLILAPLASRVAARARGEDKVRIALEARLLALADRHTRPASGPPLKAVA